MALVLITGPATEPVDFNAAQVRLRLDGNTDTDDVNAMILGARRMAEQFTESAFITQTWDLFLDGFPRGGLPLADIEFAVATLGYGGYSYANRDRYLMRRAVEIPLAPTQSITYIKYLDTAGVLQTLDPANYKADLTSAPARIVPAMNTFWPSTALLPGCVTVRFIAGYANAISVPDDIKNAILLTVGHLYENRESQELPPLAKALLSPYQVFGPLNFSR